MVAVIVALTIGGLVGLACFMLLETLVDWLASLRHARRNRVESELNQKQAELRATILNLASQLGAEAHEARKALIRESFLASQQGVPQDYSDRG